MVTVYLIVSAERLPKGHDDGGRHAYGVNLSVAACSNHPTLRDRASELATLRPEQLFPWRWTWGRLWSDPAATAGKFIAIDEARNRLDGAVTIDPLPDEKWEPFANALSDAMEASFAARRDAMQETLVTEAAAAQRLDGAIAIGEPGRIATASGALAVATATADAAMDRFVRWLGPPPGLVTPQCNPTEQTDPPPAPVDPPADDAEFEPRLCDRLASRSTEPAPIPHALRLAFCLHADAAQWPEEIALVPNADAIFGRLRPGTRPTSPTSRPTTAATTSPTSRPTSRPTTSPASAQPLDLEIGEVNGVRYHVLTQTIERELKSSGGLDAEAFFFRRGAAGNAGGDALADPLRGIERQLIDRLDLARIGLAAVRSIAGKVAKDEADAMAALPAAGPPREAAIDAAMAPWKLLIDFLFRCLCARIGSGTRPTFGESGPGLMAMASRAVPLLPGVTPAESTAAGDLRSNLAVYFDLVEADAAAPRWSADASVLPKWRKLLRDHYDAARPLDSLGLALPTDATPATPDTVVGATTRAERFARQLDLFDALIAAIDAEPDETTGRDPLAAFAIHQWSASLAAWTPAASENATDAARAAALWRIVAPAMANAVDHVAVRRAMRGEAVRVLWKPVADGLATAGSVALSGDYLRELEKKARAELKSKAADEVISNAPGQLHDALTAEFGYAVDGVTLHRPLVGGGLKVPDVASETPEGIDVPVLPLEKADAPGEATSQSLLRQIVGIGVLMRPAADTALPWRCLNMAKPQIVKPKADPKRHATTAELAEAAKRAETIDEVNKAVTVVFVHNRFGFRDGLNQMFVTYDNLPLVGEHEGNNIGGGAAGATSTLEDDGDDSFGWPRLKYVAEPVKRRGSDVPFGQLPYLSFGDRQDEQGGCKPDYQDAVFARSNSGALPSILTRRGGHPALIQLSSAFNAGLPSPQPSEQPVPSKFIRDVAYRRRVRVAAATLVRGVPESDGAKRSQSDRSSTSAASGPRPPDGELLRPLPERVVPLARELGATACAGPHDVQTYFRDERGGQITATPLTTLESEPTLVSLSLADVRPASRLRDGLAPMRLEWKLRAGDSKAIAVALHVDYAPRTGNSDDTLSVFRIVGTQAQQLVSLTAGVPNGSGVAKEKVPARFDVTLELLDGGSFVVTVGTDDSLARSAICPRAAEADWPQRMWVEVSQPDAIAVERLAFRPPTVRFAAEQEGGRVIDEPTPPPLLVLDVPPAPVATADDRVKEIWAGQVVLPTSDVLVWDRWVARGNSVDIEKRADTIAKARTADPVGMSDTAVINAVRPIPQPRDPAVARSVYVEVVPLRTPRALSWVRPTDADHAAYAGAIDVNAGEDSDVTPGTVAINVTQDKTRRWDLKIGAKEICRDVPPGTILEVRVYPIVDSASAKRFHPAFSKFPWRDASTVGASGWLLPPYRLQLEVASSAMPSPAQLFAGLAPRPSESDGLPGGEPARGVVVDLDWHKLRSVRPAPSADANDDPAPWEFLSRTTLRRQVWRPTGRPIDPLDVRAYDAGPVPPGGPEETHRPRWIQQALWERQAFAGRPEDDALSFGRALALEERGPRPRVGSGTARAMPALFVDDLTGQPAAQYYRFTLTAFSRYEGMPGLPSDRVAVTSHSDDFSIGEGGTRRTFEGVTWQSIAVRSDGRTDRRPTPPVVRRVIPLLENAGRGDFAGVLPRDAAAVSVILDEPFPLKVGFAERLLVTLDRVKSPADVVQGGGLTFAQFGPDPILSNCGSPGNSRVALADADVDGPIGHTFDLYTQLNPLFVGSSFVVRAPRQVADPSWNFARFHFRRMCEPDDVDGAREVLVVDPQFTDALVMRLKGDQAFAPCIIDTELTVSLPQGESASAGSVRVVQAELKHEKGDTVIVEFDVAEEVDPARADSPPAVSYDAPTGKTKAEAIERRAHLRLHKAKKEDSPESVRLRWTIIPADASAGPVSPPDDQPRPPKRAEILVQVWGHDVGETASERLPRWHALGGAAAAIVPTTQAEKLTLTMRWADHSMPAPGLGYRDRTNGVELLVSDPTTPPWVQFLPIAPRVVAADTTTPALTLDPDTGDIRLKAGALKITPELDDGTKPFFVDALIASVAIRNASGTAVPRVVGVYLRDAAHRGPQAAEPIAQLHRLAVTGTDGKPEPFYAPAEGSLGLQVLRLQSALALDKSQASWMERQPEAMQATAKKIFASDSPNAGPLTLAEFFDAVFGPLGADTPDAGDALLRPVALGQPTYFPFKLSDPAVKAASPLPADTHRHRRRGGLATHSDE